MKRLDCHVSNVCNIVASCVVLHNICEMFGDECLPEWIQDQPSGMQHPSCWDDENNVNTIRDAIASDMYSEH